MRILHIATGLENGGAEAMLNSVVIGDKGGSSHEVVSLMDGGFYGERLTAAGIRVHTLGMARGRLGLAALLRLYRLIRSIRPDLVQTWMYHADLLGGAAARLSGSRVVWGVHNANLDAERIARSTRWVARLCSLLSRWIPTRIIYCSEKAAQVHTDLGYCARKALVIHNGIDIDRFRPDAAARSRLRNEWQVGPDEILLGMVARWDPQKDHANLAAASAYLKSHASRHWRCVLLGSGMDTSNDEVVALLDAHGVRDRFILAGLRDDVPAVMNALDAHVLCSAGEAFGNVTVEAMACEVPAVVTSVGAGAHIVGDTGWVVPPSDARALAAALAAVVDNIGHDDWLRRKAACRTRARQLFSIDRALVQYRTAWQSAARPSP